jgi:beta-mannosidase|tara:strand:- start:277 stop:618 length:342 start_codon:yes stop_codon:yes gene_type:complete
LSTLDLHGKWNLTQTESGQSYRAVVPGDNVSALLAAGVIDDPYYGKNEDSVQWISYQTWAWSRDFRLTKRFLANDFIYLSADEIDTCSTIEINGTRVGSTRSQFMRHPAGTGG